MPVSPYLATIRAKVGHDLVALTAVSISIFDSNGRIFLAEDADTGLWTLPGGAIDPDEMPSDAAVRECWEETGLLVEPVRLIGVFGGSQFRVVYPNADQCYYTVIAFEARVIGGSPRPDGSETLSLGYFTKEEFGKLNVSRSSRVIATQAFEQCRDPYFSRPTWRVEGGPALPDVDGAR
ncbi:NUDIX domain-containing protein [Bradyrhizobium liaoningense]|uniref:NUDIX domain-containing protein n=1 Tax=Bradyrhizobium liaoningense TaxID=43992 RepID=UPI001BAA946C|nr:NUDIX domain-containing protein [Bradyrhizobium liaoningense]MBR0856674.1 NUDIX domain-containing protein [Bradyrhizobium liaoningense]